MTELRIETPRPQTPLDTKPYDSWILADGQVRAEFYRSPVERGYLLRFPDGVDFEIDVEKDRAIARPTAECDRSAVEAVFRNSVLPVLINHTRGIALHGSAVATDKGAIAFVGQSRSGKTTLAGAIARAGMPFLTEDVIDLVTADDEYWLQPQQAELRVFPDSADYLGCSPSGEHSFLADEKTIVPASQALPFCNEPKRLLAIFVLGDDQPGDVRMNPLGPQRALTSLMPHSFLLDVDDKDRLRTHFLRLADLVSDCPCIALDYERDYSRLGEVVKQIIEFTPQEYRYD